MATATTLTLHDQLLARVGSSGDLAGEAAELVLAACEGPDVLASALDPECGAAPLATPEAAVQELAPAYLRSVTVEGFRGIGKASTLEFAPGAGLTLVLGRNGSGKSSFAEALELLLTGKNARWAERTSVWKDGWRSLHHPTARIEAALTRDGIKDETTVTATSGGRGDLGRRIHRQRQAGKRRDARRARLGAGARALSAVPVLQRAWSHVRAPERAL